MWFEFLLAIKLGHKKEASYYPIKSLCRQTKVCGHKKHDLCFQYPFPATYDKVAGHFTSSLPKEMDNLILQNLWQSLILVWCYQAINDYWACYRVADTERRPKEHDGNTRYVHNGRRLVQEFGWPRATTSIYIYNGTVGVKMSVTLTTQVILSVRFPW